MCDSHIRIKGIHYVFIQKIVYISVSLRIHRPSCSSSCLVLLCNFILNSLFVPFRCFVSYNLQTVFFCSKCMQFNVFVYFSFWILKIGSLPAASKQASRNENYTHLLCINSNVEFAWSFFFDICTASFIELRSKSAR